MVIEYCHTKATLYACGVNKSCKMITFSHLNSSDFDDNFMEERVKSILVVLILSFAPFLFFIIFTFRSVLNWLFHDFFHIAFGYTVSNAASKRNDAVYSNPYKHFYF